MTSDEVFEWGNFDLQDGLHEFRYEKLLLPGDDANNQNEQQQQGDDDNVQTSTFAECMEISQLSTPDEASDKYEEQQAKKENNESILLLGCGNSKFGEQLLMNSFVGPVLQIDICSKVMQLMTQRYQKYLTEAASKRMEFIVDDAQGLTALSPDSVGGGVLDKGLIDVLHCSAGMLSADNGGYMGASHDDDKDPIRQIVDSVHRVLQPSRPFVFFSRSGPEYILRRTLGTVHLDSKRGATIALIVMATPALAFAPTSISNGRATSLRAANLDLEAILFDCDGVLADTEPDGHRVAFNIAFEESTINEEWSKERYGKLLETGGGKERMTAHWDEVGWPNQIPVLGRQDKVLGLHLKKTDIFMKLIDEGAIPLRPGVLRLVDEAIENGVKLAVCSTSNEKAVSNLVSTLMGPERASKFQVFAGDMVQKKKPAPDIYLMAVDEMGLDKTRCVIIEDSHIGVGSAVAAGISCLVTKSSYTANEDFTGAKLIVDELGDSETTGVTLQTLVSLLPGALESKGVSWSGARYGDAARRSYPTPSQWHE